MIHREQISARFKELYGEEPALVSKSPGRINIIGEHTDYNEGFVLPTAIDKAVYVALGKRDDQEIHLYAEDFTIAYGNSDIFKPIQFTVEKGDCIVFKGDNGSGKSSIIKAILGEDVPWQGRLEIAKGITISYVPQKFHSVTGNINEFVVKEQIDKTTFLTILRKLGFSRNQFEIPIENFSMGQKKKIFLAKSICEEAHLFVWDEPLNYIDVIKWFIPDK